MPYRLATSLYERTVQEGGPARHFPSFRAAIGRRKKMKNGRLWSPLESVTGIGPALPAWKAGALPLSYTDVIAQGAVLTEPQVFRSFPAARNRKRRIHAPGTIAPGWSRWSDLNRRPTDYKSVALAAELQRHLLFRNSLTISQVWAVTIGSYTPAWNGSSAGTTPQLSFYPSAGLFRSRCRWPFRLA